MHVAAKITLGIGGVLILLGIVFAVVGGATLDIDEDAFDESRASVWNGTSASAENLDLDSQKTYSVYVANGEEINSITVNGTSGNEYRDYQCEDSDPNDGWDECDNTGLSWVWVGTIEKPDCPCTMDMNATGDVIIVDDELWGEMAFEALGGLMGSLGAMSSGCCVGCIGLVALIAGIIMAITMKDAPQTGMVMMPGQVPVAGQQQPMAGQFQQPAAGQYQAPQTQQSSILPPIGGQPPQGGF